MLQAAGRMARHRSRFQGEEHSVLGRFRSRSFSYGTIAKRNLYDTGITFRNELPDLDAAGRAVYAASVEHTGRRDRLNQRRLEEKQRCAPIVSRQGMRGSAALMLVCLLALVLGSVWLVSRAGMTTTYKHISELQRRIEAAQNNMTDLEEQYAAAAASVDVGYKAVDLGMISTRNASKIYLYVPADAENGPPVTINGLYTSQLAAITGD